MFTLPLLLAVLLAALRRKPLYARLGLLWALSYVALGLWQRNEAQDMGHALAAERGHTPLRLEAKPSFANILVWKIVYETADRFYVDAVRAGLAPRVYEGTSAPKLDIARDLPWLHRDSQQAQDIERFRAFSNGYITRDPLHANRVIDIRFSMLPHEVAPLWSIELDPELTHDAHVAYLMHRDTSAARSAQLWLMLSGP